MKYAIAPRFILPIVLLALFALTPVAANAQSKGDVSKAKTAAELARDDLEAADVELEDGLQDLERIQGKLYNLLWRIDKLGSALTEYGDNVDDLEERARLLVVDAYVSGGNGVITSAFSAGNIQDLITTQALYDRAATRDLNQLVQLGAVRRQMDRLTDELAVKETEVEDLKHEQEAVVAGLAEVQTKAEAIHAEARSKYRTMYAKYKAEVARRAAAAAARASGGAAGIPSQTKGVVCPIKGSNYFINTWGYPRSGGRSHKGTDMMAAYNTKLVAMNSGSVRVNSHSLGGRQVYVYGDDGITYYYAHLSKWASGLKTGQRVSKGQIIGYVGDSGNARGTPHLHLGMIAGGVYVNPYPTVRPVC
jgi:murein DD-endopeptidase MepM/ murein hydrolase activator NlpD